VKISVQYCYYDLNISSSHWCRNCRYSYTLSSKVNHDISEICRCSINVKRERLDDISIYNRYNTLKYYIYFLYSYLCSTLLLSRKELIKIVEEITV